MQMAVCLSVDVFIQLVYQTWICIIMLSVVMRTCKVLYRTLNGPKWQSIFNACCQHVMSFFSSWFMNCFVVVSNPMYFFLCTLPYLFPNMAVLASRKPAKDTSIFQLQGDTVSDVQLTSISLSCSTDDSSQVLTSPGGMKASEEVSKARKLACPWGCSSVIQFSLPFSLSHSTHAVCWQVIIAWMVAMVYLSLHLARINLETVAIVM